MEEDDYIRMKKEWKDCGVGKNNFLGTRSYKDGENSLSQAGKNEGYRPSGLGSSKSS